jgi:CubicO group peptidase (beta-lactamase class C family)
MTGPQLSSERPARLHDIMAGHVDAGTVPGLVWTVLRRGEVRSQTIGVTAVDGDRKVTSDTIFRISSMSKPVTAVATLILVEECLLRLDEPVERLLPELAERWVV